MLNYNKINSTINYNRTPKTAIAEYLGIAESTLRNRLNNENLTPNDVEKLADFFGKSILYFFDREESNVVNEPVSYKAGKPECMECTKKLETIKDLRKTVALQDELLEKYRPQKDEGKCG